MTEIKITPSHAQMKPATKQTFVAQGLDQYGREIAIGSVQWTATGGTIDQDGVLLAGPHSGNFNVTATVEDLQATANFSTFIRSVSESDENYGQGSDDSSAMPQHPQQITWKGEVPTQKWMNFYSRVLTRFASDHNLRLTLKVEFSVDGVVSEQKLEETKVALQELGLDENLEL